MIKVDRVPQRVLHLCVVMAVVEALAGTGCRENEPTHTRREPELASRRSSRALELPGVRRNDTTALKALLDHYAAVDTLLHTVGRPPSHHHVQGDVLVADLPLEGGRRALTRLLEQKYAVLYEGRAAAGARPRGRNSMTSDSAFIGALATLLRDGLARHDAVFTTLQGVEARELILQLRTAELASLRRLLGTHPRVR